MKIHLAYLTSCRELGNKGSENVGTIIIDPETKKNLGYREGLLEHLLKKSLTDKEFASNFSIDLVIFDDLKKEYDAEWSAADLWPQYLKNSTGMTLEQISKRVPSLWRKEKNEQKKEYKKALYEQRIVKLLEEKKVDLVVVDSYRCIIGPTLLGAYRNRLINVHPGILSSRTLKTPGAFPTRDTITRARYGYIITDDKKVVKPLSGPKIFVQYNGHQREAVLVKKECYAGVTVHVITDKIDEGPIILEKIYNFDCKTMTEELLRHNNYKIKNRITPLALMMYANKNKSLFYKN